MPDTALLGRAKRVRIYVSEGDLYHHQPVHVAVLAFLHKEGAAGATVLHGIEGFGRSGVIHASHLVDARPRLPIIIEWVDSPERVERLLPHVEEMISPGLITLDDTEVAHCRTPTRGPS